jgi:hypothetical protein
VPAESSKLMESTKLNDGFIANSLGVPGAGPAESTSVQLALL